MVDHRGGDVPPPGGGKMSLRRNKRRREAISLTVCTSPRSINQSSHVAGECPVASAGSVYVCVLKGVCGGWSLVVAKATVSVM